MDAIAIIALGAFLLVGVITFTVGFVLLRLLPGVRGDRLVPGGGPGAEASESILRWQGERVGGWRGLVERVGTAITPRDATLLGRYRKRLILGGLQDPRSVTVFLGSKAVMAILAASAYGVYGMTMHRALPHVVPLSVMFGGLGFFLPDLWLRMRTARRRREMTNALPDVLDLMMVCVESGMGFDASVARITEQAASRHDPFHQELLRMHLEIRAGRPREEALRALADRVGTEELKSVVTAFIQSERLGTPLGKTLRVQAEASRVRRRHRAEKRAQLVPLLMLGPTVIFLLPSFMMVAMAPPLLRILELLQLATKIR